jgi:hypothetical protein
MLGDRPVVVSGGRRLAALRLLKAGPVAVWAPEAAEPAGLSPSARILLASVTDDLERGFNPAELTQIWRLTREETPEEDRPAIARLLGFEPRGRKALALERSALLPDRGLDMMALGRLDPENSLILAGWERPEIDQALDLFDRAWPSRQNRRLWLEWLDDLRRSEGPAALSGLLASPELAGLSGPGAEKAARDHIRALRFPRLTELGHRRREALKALDLPKGLKLGLDPDFEDVTATVSLTFSDAPELRRLATSAMELADQGTLDRLWALEDRSR